MLSPRMFVAQRITALILAPLVVGHLALIIYAVQGGLDAAEILARTRANWWLAAYYELFVAAVAVHAAIGVRVVCAEVARGKLTDTALNIISFTVSALLFCLGTFAVVAVVIA